MPKPTHWSRCTAQKENGRFCDDPTIPDAPFPICFRHAAQLYRFLRGRITADTDQETALEHVATLFEPRAQVRSSADRVVVYYVQVGDLIKIGSTTRLADRLKDYPPNRRLLATEDGDCELETRRHGQFRELLMVGREWFRPGQELVDHINELRRRQRVAGKPLTVVEQVTHPSLL